VEQLYRVSDAFLGRQAEERPYLILGAAAGVGFILGGGLASRMGGTLLNVVGRLAVTHAVDAWVSSNLAPQAGGVDAQ
jgi:Na+/H+-dicarboxylate symporter